MKSVCHREGLLTACQLAGAALPAREVKPILKNFKAVTKGDHCTLMATDLELGIRLQIQGLTIEEPGEAILPAKKLTDILREARDEQLRLEANIDQCTVSGATLYFEMPSEDPVNFPDVPEFTGESYHEISAGLLRQLIRRTAFAAASQQEKYATNGVLWELEGNHITLVATDGRRLACAKGITKPVGTSKVLPSVIPTKAVSLLERNLQDDDATVRVALKPNEVLFSTEGEQAVIYSRLVEGRFPNYREILNKKHTVKINLQVGPFLHAVRQAAVMVDEESQRVIFHFGKGKLVLQAQGSTTGRSKVEMPLEYEGKNIEIGFNPKYLLDMLKVFGEDDFLTIELTDGNTAALLRVGEEYIYLLMPMG